MAEYDELEKPRDCNNTLTGGNARKCEQNSLGLVVTSSIMTCNYDKTMTIKQLVI